MLNVNKGQDQRRCFKLNTILANLQTLLTSTKFHNIPYDPDPPFSFRKITSWY